MKTIRSSRNASLAVLAWTWLGTAAALAAPVPLVTIDGDTLTTTELAMELGVMMSRAPADVQFEAPEPERVLRRMIQNELVIQEGYRMDLDQRFSVRNPRSDAVRNECVKTLLDSVADEVEPGDLPLEQVNALRQQHVRTYLDDLHATHGVRIDTLLLQSLDYGSTDAEVKKHLANSDEVIAVLPNGDITVAELTREIRFVAFHGLEGKPDADARRDRIFWQNLEERLVAFEAKRIGLDKDPEIVAFAARVERDLMLQETLGILVQFDFAPTEPEVQAFYEANLDAVTPPARIRMESVKLSNEEAAGNLRAKAVQGAKLSWLAKNMPDVIDGPPPFPAEFFLPQQLAIDPADVEVGLIPEPYGVPGGWVVARIAEVEKVSPRPLPDCRDEILRMMKAKATQEHMIDVIDRLEAVSTIVQLPGAEEETARVTALLVATREAELAAKAATPPAP